ncbi:hypothetical protein L2449_16785 [Mesorhizobium muleiense]|uniref:hypothetical protein n=1 Tax=Mesorhizobium muleiense TaxID=1004279 RepID=UPI001F22931E|nr:hypothetical protein [Mesorhizobium muleiense]MCF6118535.1 hypothetical protein [Mesorhizobium muleiense]
MAGLPLVVGDPAATLASPVMLVDASGNPIDATHPITVAGAGNVASGATDSGNPVKVGGVYNTTLPVLTNGQRGDVQLGVNGDLRTLSDLVATTPADGITNSSGNFGINGNSAAASGALRLIVSPLKFNGTTHDRDRKPNASYPTLASAAASTNATSVKASAGDLWCISGFNAAASVRYLKIFNKASAPTVGTDTPILNLALPVGAFNLNLGGHYCSTGIAFALTTGAALLDTTALTAADIVGLTLTYA